MALSESPSLRCLRLLPDSPEIVVGLTGNYPWGRPSKDFAQTRSAAAVRNLYREVQIAMVAGIGKLLKAENLRWRRLDLHPRGSNATSSLLALCRVPSTVHYLHCFARDGRRARQPDQKGSSRARRLFDRHRATVIVDYFVHDGEPQPGSVRFPITDEGFK